MFAQIQNVVSTRDLFNSNPCRDFWDSQQFSQAASGSQTQSQGSQSSSLELYSQSKSSQQQHQKHDSSYDSWHNTGNSQKINEEEPVKYYMKYLSKPPLFSEQSKHDQEKAQTESFKDFIEAQKIKAIERDQRELLDSFIGLLKDYTKEVQTAMQSFKESLDSSVTTNSKNAEKIKSAAEKSFSTVDELKEDFKSSFNKLRSDLKENEELKTMLSKKEQDLHKLDLEIQLQKKQIEDLKRKEDDAVKKEEEFKQKEEKLLERIKEAELRISVLRDTPPPSQEPQATHNDAVAALHPNPNQILSNSLPMLAAYSLDGNHGPRRSRIDYSRFQCVTQVFPPEHNPYDQVYHGEDLLGPGRNSSYFPSRCSELNNRIQHSETRPLSSSNCPTASITPVQKSKSQTQCLPKTTTNPMEKENPATSPSTPLPFTHAQDANDQASGPPQIVIGAPSPANRVSLMNKSKFPKKSPVATVLPQIQVKPREYDQSKVLTGHQRKKQPHDPAGIFSFELSTSPQITQPGTINNHHEVETILKKETPKSPGKITRSQSQKKRKSKKCAEQPFRKYDTRSCSKLENNSDRDQIDGKQVEHSNNCQTTTPSVSLKRKVFNSTVAHQKKKKCSGELSGSKGNVGNAITGKGPLETGQENGLTNVSRSLESSFRRQRTEKRILDLTGSSLFGIVDEEISIQQIAESIRKHAQKRRMKQKTL